MYRRSAVVSLFSLGLFGFAALNARPAAAQSCASDSDCVKGWLCKVTSSSGCGYACPAGQTCPPPPDCPTQEYKSCVPGPCTADSDCAAGMVCYTTQVGCDAPQPACPPGADCVEPPPCRPSTQSQCIPRYDAPCTVDADCGAGFTCMTDVTGCGCASASSAPSNGGSSGGSVPTPTDPPTCDCTPATTSSCHALPQTCDTTADCANGWTCETVAQAGGCVVAEPAPSSGGTGSSTPVPAQDAGVDPCPPPPPPVKECMPPYYSLGAGTVGVFASDGVGGGTAKSGVTSGAAGSTSAPKTPTENADNGQTSTAAGCSIAHNSRSGEAGFALLGLAMFGWLRRRRLPAAVR